MASGGQGMAGGGQGMATRAGGNRLAGELSPYLRQHQHNPVHWWVGGVQVEVLYHIAMHWLENYFYKE